ncbi:MAG: hypothetical protein ACYDEQ_01745 [Desulfocucumaceae bacterium]
MPRAGAIGYAVEHAVFEQLYGIESVSTEKILYLANQQGIPIYSINRDNINQTLPLISAPAIVKQNISDSVLNSGWIAVIPQRAYKSINGSGMVGRSWTPTAAPPAICLPDT